MYVAITATKISCTDHWYWPVLKQQYYIWTQMSWQHQKLYKQAGKCDDQQQFKDILGGYMVSTPEVFTNNSPISTSSSSPVNKPSAQKSLCMFTNVL